MANSKACKRHRSVASVSVPYSGPVAFGRLQNKFAHGHVCRIETCACGAVRRVNINGVDGEPGPWVLA